MNTFKEQTIAFVTSNDDKVKEFERILKRAGSRYIVKKANEKLDEPSNPKSLEELVRLKTTAAFKKYKMPIVVEHTLLDIGHLYGLPGYTTDYVTRKLNNYAICELMCCTNNRHAVAKTLIGYCDGKKVYVFEGVVKGQISNLPRGENGFGWDSIFIPDDEQAYGKTFGQMTQEEKDSVSMRKKAIDALVNHLIKTPLSYYDDSNSNLKCLLNSIECCKKNDEHNLILFLGAGISRNLGFVSWNELLLNIMEEMGYDREIAETLSDDPLQLAEFCMQVNSKALYKVFNQSMKLQKDLGKKLYQSLVHRSIVELKPYKIYTTNYETTIEKAFELFSDEKQNSLQLEKIHGDINKKIEFSIDSFCDFKEKFNEAFVLTETSYLSTFDKIQNSKSEFQHLLDDLKNPKNTFLFIGYGMGDINIKYLIHKSRGDELCKKNTNLTKKCSRNTFAKLFFYTTKPEPVQEMVLTSKGVKTIYGDDPDHKIALENFMFKLIESKFE